MSNNIGYSTPSFPQIINTAQNRSLTNNVSTSGDISNSHSRPTVFRTITPKPINDTILQYIYTPLSPRSNDKEFTKNTMPTTERITDKLITIKSKKTQSATNDLPDDDSPQFPLKNKKKSYNPVTPTQHEFAFNRQTQQLIDSTNPTYAFAKGRKNSSSSPIGYMGSAHQIIPHLLQLIPKNTQTVVSPFAGGMSLELVLGLKGIRVISGDKSKEVANFWQRILGNNSNLAQEIRNLKHELDNEIKLIADSFVPKDTPTEKQDSTKRKLRKNTQPLEHSQDEKCRSLLKKYGIDELNQNPLKAAAAFFITNQGTFNNLTFAKLSGFYYEKMNKIFDSSIKKIETFKSQLTNNISVKNIDYKQLIAENTEELLFVDPPYFYHKKGAQSFYGTNGKLHTDFDHVEFYQKMKNRTKWIMRYNDCPEIRNLYQQFTQVNVSLTSIARGHNGKNNREINELIILSPDIAVINHNKLIDSNQTAPIVGKII